MADDEVFEDAFSGPSKSALKREMTRRQNLGEALCELSERELERIPIESAGLLEAIHECALIRSNSALRRHRQYIGKLMRDIDPEPIQAALDALHDARQEDTAAFKALETLRDKLIREGDGALTAVIETFPHADRQQLRQLVRDAQRELSAGKPPAASRRLFRQLRELQASD